VIFSIKQQGSCTPNKKLRSHTCAAIALSVAATLALPSALSAQTSPGSEAGCPNVNPGLPISVAADQSEFQKLQSRVLLTGSVTIEQGVLTLFADRVTINYQSGDTRDMGTQGTISSLLAEGTVKVECEGDRAHGRKALYDVANKDITLTGDVLLVRGDNVLKGEKLTIDLATGNTAIEGGAALVGQEKKDTRIKAVFTPPPEKTSEPESSDEQ